MLKSFLGSICVALVTVGSLASCAVAAAPPQTAASPRPTGAVLFRPQLIDVDKTLPSEIQLVVGQRVFFTHKIKLGRDKWVTTRTAVLSDVQKAHWPLPISSSVVAGFEASSVGVGEIEVHSRVVAPNTPTHTTKVKVKVVAHTVPTTTVAHGASSGFKGKLQRVITTDADWNKLWSQHTSKRYPPLAAPQIDFTKEMVIVVWTGSRSSGGYSVAIEKVEDDGQNLVVTYRETRSSSGGRTLALTQPHHAVTVPLSSRPVRFQQAP